MAGCYGNSKFDRYWENQLDQYLKTQEDGEEEEIEETADDDTAYDRAKDEIAERGEYREGEVCVHNALRRARNKE